MNLRFHVAIKCTKFRWTCFRRDLNAFGMLSLWIEACLVRGGMRSFDSYKMQCYKRRNNHPGFWTREQIFDANHNNKIISSIYKFFKFFNNHPRHSLIRFKAPWKFRCSFDYVNVYDILINLDFFSSKLEFYL